MSEKEKVLEVKNLVISFKTDNGLVRAVRDISFDLYKGETLCIVGESGSGKSVTSKAIMGILAANALVDNGQIMYEGENLLEVSEDEMHRIRGHKIGMIFQDPLSSLNPIVKIGKQITEAMLINSNKLKIMFNNLISEELVAYKNEVAKKNLAIKKAKNDFIELQYGLTNGKDKLTKEEKADNKVKIKEGKKELKEAIRLAKEEFKTNSPALKEALKLKKAEAKQKVKDYEKKLDEEFALKAEELIKKYANDSVELKKQLKELKDEYIDKTKITKAAAKKKALEVMKEVGIPMPEKRFYQYPFEFSGGMRQRIVIAIALTASPEILICDEPTTALDVTIQAQILELIKKIQAERQISCIFITHDLGVVANMADRVAVMYAGKIVEYGTSEEVFFDPRHPYTWALLSSIPDVDSKERLDAIPGTPPNMIYPPKGDAFALRSKYAMKIDFEHEPPYYKVSDTHYAKTWLLHPNAPKAEMPKIVSERIKIALDAQKKLVKEGLKDE
jgi:oligopeptide transport system ATP-binding protein